MGQPHWLNVRPPFRPLPDGKIGSLRATSAGGKTGSNNLRARAKKQGLLWLPGRAGGNHAAPWPQPVLDLLGKRLNGSPPCPDSFVARRRSAATTSNSPAPKSAAGPSKTIWPTPARPKQLAAGGRHWQPQRMGEPGQLED